MSAVSELIVAHLSGKHADEPVDDCVACQRTARRILPDGPQPARVDKPGLPSGRTCECGCGGTPGPRARFIPGHDAKLKSRLVGKARQECRCLMSGDEHIDTCGPNNARKRLVKLGWDRFI